MANASQMSVIIIFIFLYLSLRFSFSFIIIHDIRTQHYILLDLACLENT